MSNHTIVLFDIDGTLVTGPDDRPSAGLLAMNRASFLVTEDGMFGPPEELLTLSDAEIALRFKLGDPREFAGRTDLQIANMLLKRINGDLTDETLVSRLLDEYLLGLELFITESPYTALGDAAGCNEILRTNNIVIGLGTGNVAKGASLKLESAGISEEFDISLGGYGDDGDTRAEVLLKGAHRCGATSASKIVIVGDTPRDISAAKEIGAVSVGIPYRGNTPEILADCGADIVMPSVGPTLASWVTENVFV